MAHNVNELFDGPAPFSHPKLRYWVAASTRAPEHRYLVEILRPRLALGFGTPRLYVHVLDRQGDETCSPDEMFWDEDLDEGFITAGFQAISVANESMRFGLALKRSFSKAERRFGEGFFNGVLVRYFHESPFSASLIQQKILNHIHVDPVDDTRPQYADCREMIEAALSLRARQLESELHYPRREAIHILDGAIGWYLDERFSVTDRALASYDRPHAGQG